MNSHEQTLEYQRIWENLVLPKAYRLENQQFRNPVIFFVVSGSIKLEINNEEVHYVSSQEMFMAQSDNLYSLAMLEPTHFLKCHVPMETWFIEQKWIDGLIEEDNTISEVFFKLPVKKVITHYLSLLVQYLKEAIYPSHFFELKRQELFYLLFYSYKGWELAQFLQCILSKDIQFKKFVINNYFYAKNVRELAKSANYSTSGFIKKFQKCFDDSPYKWMQKQKAKHILFEINQGIKSLQEIANEYKFSSYQHFSVFCKEQFGSPPTKISSKNRVIKPVNNLKRQRYMSKR